MFSNETAMETVINYAATTGKQIRVYEMPSGDYYISPHKNLLTTLIYD